VGTQVKYVKRRDNGIFYYVRRVPLAVVARADKFQDRFRGKHLFRQSLETRDQSEAMVRGAETHRWFEGQVKLALGLAPELTAPRVGGRPVTADALTKVRATVRERMVKPWRVQAMLAETGGDAAEIFDHMVHQRELDGAAPLERLLNRTESEDVRLPHVDEIVARLVRDTGFDAPPESHARAALARAVREGLVTGQRDVDKLIAGELSFFPEKPSQASTPKISKVMEDYIAQLTAMRTVREARNALSSFINVVGDLPLDEIKRSHLQAFCEAEGNRVVGGKDPRSVRRTLSPQTLKKKVTLLRAAINRAIATGRYEGANPAANINAEHFTKPTPKALLPDKRPFNIDEINRVLAHPWFTGCRDEQAIHEPGDHRLTGMHYWVPLLALYTGARAGELGGLRVNEVRLDHQHPHFVIQPNSYRSTKGSYRRLIPVLDVLLTLGFDHYVERISNAGHDRLFPDWKPPRGKVQPNETAWSNGQVIRAFNRTVIPLSLGTLLAPGVRQEVTFHGFRGAFKTLLQRPEYGVPMNYLHEVVGHAKTNLDKRYVGEIPIEETYPLVRHCNYPGIKLPTSPWR
jgi:integrase